MPRLDEPDSEGPIKGLILGNSGAGKTGSLASLAKAGYQLHIADFDSGTNILRNVLKGDKEALRRIEVETFTDVYGGSPQVRPIKIQAWAKALDQFTKWSNQYQTLDHVLVVDSLNFMSKTAFNWILQMAGRLTSPKEIQDWGAVQDLVGNFLMKLYSSEVKCHVLVLSHISYQGSGDSDIKIGYPMTSVGRSFNPSVPRYFNSVLLCRNTGTGIGNKREIWTAPVDFVDLKTESLAVKKTYPLETGMAQFFFDVRGVKPANGEKAAIPQKAAV